jgi:beta-lactamase regulating signal transducer with metallopeptidase domain
MGPYWLISALWAIGICIVLPKTIFQFIGIQNKHKRELELEKLKYQKEILELELEKQRNEIKLLEEENRKYDKIIGE